MAINNLKLETALYDLRGKLSIRKIVSDFIKRSEFKALVEEVKLSNKDEEVSKAIDDLFKDELLLTPQKNENLQSNDSQLTLADLEAKINSYDDNGINQKSAQKVLSDGHFNSTSSSNAA